MMPDLMIIGTAHVIDLSLPLERYIKNFSPDLIALELDKQRWYALKTKSQRTAGPFFLRVLARLQKYLGDYFGSSPGSEMIVATNIANSIGAKLAFIDKPILQTIQGAWKNMPWNELFGIIIDSMISFVGGGDSNIENSMKTGDFSKELDQFSSQYPYVKKELIDKRDIYMSTNIVKLFRSQNCDRMVAIVGEGHVEGMAEKLVSLNPKIIKLSDLLQSSENSVSFSIEI